MQEQSQVTTPVKVKAKVEEGAVAEDDKYMTPISKKTPGRSPTTYKSTTQSEHEESPAGTNTETKVVPSKQLRTLVSGFTAGIVCDPETGVLSFDPFRVTAAPCKVQKPRKAKVCVCHIMFLDVLV